MCSPGYFPRDHISHLNNIRIQPQRLISARSPFSFMTILAAMRGLLTELLRACDRAGCLKFCTRCADARLTGLRPEWLMPRAPCRMLRWRRNEDRRHRQFRPHRTDAGADGPELRAAETRRGGNCDGRGARG